MPVVIVARRFGLLLFAVGLIVSCAPTPPPAFPEGPGRPLLDYHSAFESSTTACRQVRTMEMVLAIKGQTGLRRLRGRVRGALQKPASVRLEGLAPFGAAAFFLVVDPPGEALLLLPRDRRVVTHGDGGELLGSLTGLALRPDDFRAVLTGCVVPDPRPVGGRAYGDGLRAIELEGNATIFLRPVDGALVVTAGTRPGMRVEYSNHVRGLPRHVRVLASDATGAATDLTATLSQVSINIELDPDVFVAPAFDDYGTMTLDQFRGAVGPLEALPEETALPR